MKKLIIIGAGGFGREIAQYIDDINKLKCEYEILGYIDDDVSKIGLTYNNIKVLGDMTILLELNTKYEIYVFCAIANPFIKMKKSKQIKEYGNKTINIIHPTSYISKYVTLGQNVLISPFCVLTTNIVIGDYVHINPQCGIGHDTTIDDYTTLYWSVNTGGFTHIGIAVELGTKTFIKQGIIIGDKVVSGAGAVIIKDVQSKAIVKGVPAI